MVVAAAAAVAAVAMATLRGSYFTAVRPVKGSSKPSIAAIWLPRHESEVMEPGLSSPVVSSDTVIELSKQASTDLTRKNTIPVSLTAGSCAGNQFRLRGKGGEMAT